jgi:hypothetical protein
MPPERLASALQPAPATPRERAARDRRVSDMAEVLVQFDSDVRADDGTPYTPRVCARLRDDGMWEGWIEFVPSGEGDGSDREPLRTARETEQSERDEVVYWASGLTAVYLEGALARARDVAGRPRPPRLAPRRVDAQPHFDGPAPD